MVVLTTSLKTTAPNIRYNDMRKRTFANKCMTLKTFVFRVNASPRAEQGPQVTRLLRDLHTDSIQIDVLDNDHFA